MTISPESRSLSVLRFLRRKLRVPGTDIDGCLSELPTSGLYGFSAVLRRRGGGWRRGANAATLRAEKSTRAA